MDGRRNNGGARNGAGRKPKADEIALAEKMDAIMMPEAVWEKLAQLAASGDTQALKLWLSYRYGLPKQTIDANIFEADVNWVEEKIYVNASNN